MMRYCRLMNDEGNGGNEGNEQGNEGNDSTHEIILEICTTIIVEQPMKEGRNTS